MFHESDGDLSFLKDKTIAVIGYGNQGHAHAQNLRDSGLNVIIGQRSPGARYDLAVSHRFAPITAAQATKRADFIMITLPDEAQPSVYKNEIEPNLSAGKTLAFCHGFNIRYGQITPPENIDVVMVAPMGPGTAARSEYEAGRGLISLIAVHQDASGEALERALAYAKGIGGLRAAGILTTFEEETETDLFGEQAVLCGGISALVKASFETLVEAGYQPEIAYFVVLHELAGTVKLLVQGGLTHKNAAISNTAEYGDLTRGPRIINEQSREALKEILGEIQSGEFADEWLKENAAGRQKFDMLAKLDSDHLIERVGLEMRKLMPWLEAK